MTLRSVVQVHLLQSIQKEREVYGVKVFYSAIFGITEIVVYLTSEWIAKIERALMLVCVWKNRIAFSVMARRARHEIRCKPTDVLL